MTRILGISGSLRRDSHNTSLLRAAAEAAGPDVELELYDGLKEVPPYDEDDDVHPGPASVARLNAAIANADAVLFATPEYNASDPGRPCQRPRGTDRRNSRTPRREGLCLMPIDASVSKGRAKRIRVGIIGANPDRGWAAQAHIPALRSLSDDFEITALSTTRRESADAASKLFGVPVAFDNHQELVNSPAVDVVAVTVKVPHHLELASAAIEAGKAVYCEWPLGNGLKEAETLAALAKKKRVLAVAGLQARSAPSVAYVRDLIEQGYVGEVLSTTFIGSGMGWGPTVEPFNVYL